MKQVDKQLALLQQLSYSEDFIAWRDLVAKPIIDQLEFELNDPMKWDEANLKAKVLHLNSMKYAFYTIFEQAKAQLKLDK